ncbi:hypothetical protein ACH47Z_05730 [Streptomyces sp. NPDC020192]|uniref:hypothetical protein n=1 Tax=Streptomyces sp. NPDC020192 TaxID=3365066 RepID=UPI0037B7398E
MAAFGPQPNGFDELGALHAGVVALAVLGAPGPAARLHAAVTGHAARTGTDPGHCLRFAGLPPAERGSMGWEEMVALFTRTAEALPLQQGRVLQDVMGRHRDPLLWAAFDLQFRLFNIVARGFLGGSERQVRRW